MQKEKTTMKILSTLAIVALAMAIATTSASAQVLNSNAGSVTLNATLPESLTVTVTAGNIVSIPLTANTAANPGATTTTVKTAWVLKATRTNVSIWAFVANSAAALSDGASPADNIPANAVSVAAAGSGSAGGLLSASPSGAGVPTFITAGGSGVQIGNVNIAAANRASSTTTTLTWNIDTTVTPQLPAAAYTGTVNIQAQATP
jgi:hypothetical protein